MVNNREQGQHAKKTDGLGIYDDMNLFFKEATYIAIKCKFILLTIFTENGNHTRVGARGRLPPRTDPV